MKNYKVLTIIWLLIVFLMSGCTRMPVYTSQHISESDALPRPFMHKASKMLYSVAHDDTCLYLTLSTRDFATQRQIMMTGLRIWIDQKAKRGEYLGIHYPAMGEGSEDMLEFKERPQIDKGSKMGLSNESQKLFECFKQRMHYIDLIGFNGNGSSLRIINKLEKAPVKVDLDMDSTGLMIYTLLIPFNKIFTIEKFKDNLLSIGVICDMPDIHFQGQIQGSYGYGADTYMPGSTSVGSSRIQDGGQLTGSSGSPVSIPSDVKFWFKTQLSVYKEIH